MHINWRVKLVSTRNWAVYFYIISLKKEAYDQESIKINHALKRSRKVLISSHTCLDVSNIFFNCKSYLTKG